MPILDYRFPEEEVNHADLAEAPRRERESKAKSIGIGVVVSLVLLGLAVLMIFGSQPALTPEEIVGREDYEGQQPARHIFNLYSLKQDQLRREAERAKEAVTTNAEMPFIPVNQDKKTSEMPASAGGSRPRSVSGPSYVKSELTRTPVSVVGAVTRQVSPAKASPAKASPEPGSSVTVLPVYTIKGSQTNMRSLPTTDAPILQILDKGQTVTVFDETSEWVQVAVNDGSGISGYIHQSLLENLNK